MSALKKVEKERQAELVKDHLAKTYLGSGKKSGEKMSRRKKILRYVVGFALMACSLPLFVFAGYLYGFEKGRTVSSEIPGTLSVTEAQATPIEVNLEPIVVSKEVAQPHSPIRGAVEKALTLVEGKQLHVQFADISATIKNAVVKEELMKFGDKSVNDRKDLDSVTTLLWQYGNILIENKDYKEAENIFRMISDKFSHGKVPDYRGIGIEIDPKVKDKLQWLQKQNSVAKASPE